MAIERENSTPPEWMVALENKKKHHKLAHEVGAGAPCLNCSDGCLGLDLHFWRKICRNCKCKKEEHDVKEENNAEQFEILFGADLKCGDRVKKISLNLKCKFDDIFSTKEMPAPYKSNSDLSFDWIPLDVPPNLASEYLQQIPLEKLPITGSAGAMFRRQQLQKQMPLYDFKANDCNELTDEETKAFSEYVDNLKNNAVGMGQITKIIPVCLDEDNATTKRSTLPLVSNTLNSTPKPYKGFTATWTEDNQDKFTPSELSATSETAYPTCELKTPSAFIPYQKLNVKFGARNINESNANKSFDNENRIDLTSAKDLPFDCQQKLNINENLDSQNNNLTTFEENLTIANENLTPSQIIRKFNSQNTVRTLNAKNNLIKQSNEWHGQSEPYANQSDISSPVRDFVMDAVSPKNADVKFLKLGTPEQFVALSSYVPNSPQHSNALSILRQKGTTDNTNIPYDNRGTARNELINRNYPISTHPNITAVNPEILCRQCKGIIYPGQVVVVTERTGVEVVWHPQCFVCTICQELLVDLVYFFHREEVYCGRHYAEVLKIPRCYACDELIFAKEYTIAEGQTFHVKHFCCFECDIPLAGKRYVPKNNNPICLPCVETKYGKRCVYCEKMIKVSDSRVGWQELNWHATASCFKCIHCCKSLLNNKFLVKNNRALCSKECLDQLRSVN